MKKPLSPESQKLVDKFVDSLDEPSGASEGRTPRTDAAICERRHTPNVWGFKEHDRVEEFVNATFARQLERELAEQVNLKMKALLRADDWCRKFQHLEAARSATAPVDPDSEAANPVWDLVINACAQAWPAKTIVWNQSPIELIVQIINERDEALARVPVAPISGMKFIRLLKNQRDKVATALRDIHARGLLGAYPSTEVAVGELLKEIPSYEQQLRNIAEGIGMTYEELMAALAPTSTRKD